MAHKDIIDITDLLDPVLTPFQQQVREGAAAHPVTLTVDGILNAAREQTGLSDFGDMDFVERLGVWVQAVNDDAGAGDTTRHQMHGMFLRYAATRLRVEDVIRKNPEILDIKIDRPIIVAGLPRSGTTHLLGLISADSRLRSLPWWEAIAPVPLPGEPAPRGREDPRWQRADADWKVADQLLPYMKAMHEFSPDHISEDIELQALDFSSYLLEWLTQAPGWRDYYFAHDQSHMYAYLKKGLQLLTWYHGPNRWVIKCPQHMEQLPVLKKTFPDATFVITHRDPVASIQSAITMSTYAGRVSRKDNSPAGMKAYSQELLAYWTDRYQRLLRNCVRDRDVLPAGQTVDVYFHQWTKDPDTILREIYRRAEIPLTDETLAELHAYLDANPHGQYGKVVYDLKRDFGVSAADIRAKFDFYFERFPVVAEVK